MKDCAAQAEKFDAKYAGDFDVSRHHYSPRDDRCYVVTERSERLSKGGYSTSTDMYDAFEDGPPVAGTLTFPGTAIGAVGHVVMTEMG